MYELGNPFNIESLRKATEKVSWLLMKRFDSLTLDQFYTRYDDRWSAWDIMHYLGGVIKPFAFRFRLPKILLWFILSKARRHSVRYDQVKSGYLNALKKGATPGRFIPPIYEIPDTEEEADDIRIKDLKKFEKTFSSFQKALAVWDNENIDLYLVDSPMLGQITMRESVMLILCMCVDQLDALEHRLEAVQPHEREFDDDM
jgi:hypothetical protein